MGQNITRAKQTNRSMVLESLLRLGPLSRQQIAELTHLTPSTITNLTTELIEEELILETGLIEGEERRAGRKSVALDLRDNSAWVAGVHVRVDRIELGLVNLKGVTQHFTTVPLPPDLNQDEFLQLVSQQLQNYLQLHKAAQIKAVGVGTFGLVNFEDGNLVSSDHKGWKGVRLAAHLTSDLQLPVYVDNNVRAMALGEKLFGESRQLTDFLCIYIGQGIGAGLVFHDQIYRGGTIGGGEFGHMTYLPDGYACWCGNRGCLERYASEAAILNELNFSSMEQLLAVDPDDVQLFHALQSAGERIGTVLASFVNMVQVQKVVVGGLLSNPKYPVVAAIRQTVKERSFLARREEVEVAGSSLGEYLGVTGAASLAVLHEIVRKGIQQHQRGTGE